MLGTLGVERAPSAAKERQWPHDDWGLAGGGVVRRLLAAAPPHPSPRDLAPPRSMTSAWACHRGDEGWRRGKWVAAGGGGAQIVVQFEEAGGRG